MTLPHFSPTVRLKHIARMCYGDALPSDARSDGDVPVFGSNGPVGNHSEANTLSPAVIVGRKGSYGKISYSDKPAFCIDTAYYIDQRHSDSDLRWLFYALQTLPLDSMSQDTGVPGLSREWAYEQRLPDPPLAVQRRMSSYLDQKTAAINALVTKQRRLIELLHEQRQAIIARSVTNGLDDSSRMKASGLEWADHVPSHWSVVRLKYLGRFQAGSGFPHEEQGNAHGEIPFFKVSDMNALGNEVILTSASNYVTERTARKLGASILPPGSIVFPKIGAALLTNKRRITGTPCCVDNNVMAFTPKNIDSTWIYYVLLNLDFGQLVNPGAVPSINESQVSNIKVPVPPIQEQKKIAVFLDRETSQIDSLIAKTKESIDKLTEYKISLITAAVTGQIEIP